MVRSTERVLKDDGLLFLNVGYSNQEPWGDMDVAKRAGMFFELQNRFIWVKSVAIDEKTHGHFKPINSNRFVTPTHESIFHFTKTGDVPVDRLAIGVPYKWKCNQDKVRRASGRLVKKMGFKNWRGFERRASNEERGTARCPSCKDRGIDREVPDFRCQGNTWFIPYETIKNRSSDRGKHPATSPVELPRRCIKLSGMKPGSVVYDPFVGTGSAMLAARELGMLGVGTDIDGSYLEFAAHRLADGVHGAS